MADLETLPADHTGPGGRDLTYRTRPETHHERVLNRARNLFSRVVFRGVRLRSKLMKLSDKAAIVFAPHQDDETFGCGGLIALKRERGIPVKVVILTDGAACLGDDVTGVDRERIADLRNAEVAAATAVLGLPPENLEFLSYPDGRLDCLSDAERTEAVERISTLLRAFQPEEVYVTHRHDHHRDHEAAYRMVTDAIKRSGLTVDLLQYPIWLVWFSGFGRRLRWRDLADGLVLPIHGVSRKKREAVRAFRSQLETLPSGSVKRFYSPYELFFATKISAGDRSST